jgi:hypothetical protein
VRKEDYTPLEVTLLDEEDITRLTAANLRANPFPLIVTSVIVCLAALGALLVYRAAGNTHPLAHEQAEGEKMEEENRIMAMPWQQQFKHQAFIMLPYKHWWLSIFFVQQSALTSRMERLGCLLSLVLGSMAANAMFYGQHARHIASMATTSFVSAFALLPVRLTLTLCFHKSQNQQDKAGQKYVQQIVKPKPPTSPLASSPAPSPPPVGVSLGRSEHQALPQGKESSPNTKRSKLLPYGCRLFGYVVLMVWCVGAVVTVLAYGLKFDMDDDSECGRRSGTSKAWILSVLLSNVQDIFLMDPLFIVLSAAASTAAVTWLKGNPERPHQKIASKISRKLTGMGVID